MSAVSGPRGGPLATNWRIFALGFLVVASPAFGGLLGPSPTVPERAAAVSAFALPIPGIGGALGSSPAAATLLNPDWRDLPVSGGPPGDAEGSLAYDPHAGVVVWVGGNAGGLAETWTYSTGNWTNLTATLSGSPPASPGAMLAADPAHDEVVWAGAYAGAASLATWTFGNGSWANLTGSVGTTPAARGFGSFAYDPQDQQVLLFGGTAVGLSMADTWTFGGSAWTQLIATTHPSARELAGLAYDGAIDGLLLEGGETGSAFLNDTWTFESGSWSQVTGAIAPPGLSMGPDALVSAPGGGVIGFGGLGCPATFGVCNQTYEFSAGNWSPTASQHAPSPRVGLALAYDGVDGYDLAFGGALGVGEPARQTWALGGPVAVGLKILPVVAQPDETAYYVTTVGGGYGPYTFNYSGGTRDCPTLNLSTMPCFFDSDDSGNFTLTVRVTDALANSSSVSEPLNIQLTLNTYAVVSSSGIDVGQPLTFNVTLSKPSIGANYTWNGLPADCPYQFDQNFTCRSYLPGFYAVYCFATDTWGTTSQSSTTGFQINPDPSIIAWPGATGGQAPLTVPFHSIVTGGSAPFTYAWNFSDGTTSNVSNPVHTFASVGSFPVSLMVTDSAGVSVNWSNPATIVAGSAFSVHLSVSTASWEAPVQVILGASVVGGTAPYSFAWDLGNGQNASLANVTAEYAQEGSYTVSLTVTDHLGLIATSSASLTVLENTSGTSVGSNGGSTTPTWEIAVVGAVAAIIGVAIGVWFGGRRRRSNGDPSD
ncbi:MAG: PKD domain-containing protein [Thermoplasmata archaeon]|nr:PKD domain-containing protein [Thermoplasmata archaeon]